MPSDDHARRVPQWPIVIQVSIGLVFSAMFIVWAASESWTGDYNTAYMFLGIGAVIAITTALSILLARVSARKAAKP